MKIQLINSCLNCEKEIPMDFMLCTTKCGDELKACAKSQGVVYKYDMDEVWKKPKAVKP